MLRPLNFYQEVSLFLICLGSWAAPAWSGVVEVDRQGGQTYLSGSTIKNIPAGESTWYVFDTEQDRITLIDDQDRTYTQGNAEEYCSALAEVTDERLQAMSPEERQMMDQIMGILNGTPREQPQIDITEAGPGEAIAGLPTRKYQVLVDGNLQEEIWLAPDPALLEGVDIEAISRYGQKISACIGKALRMDGGMMHLEDSPEYGRLIRQGWVMRSIRNDPLAGSEVVTEVERLERRQIPEEEFQAPADYDQLPLAEFLRAQATDGPNG